MDPLLEQTSPWARFRRTRSRRKPSRFEVWAWSPIVAFRIGLTLGYAGMVYFGISGMIAGVPAFKFTAPDSWTPIWAAAMILGGILGAIGSIGDSLKLRMVELSGSWLLFLTVGSYAAILLVLAYGLIGETDLGRAPGGSGLLALSIQPFVRMLWLMSQLGRRK